jgi:hypothetical protein
MIVSQADASVDALDSCSVGDVNRLKVFQPDEWRDEGLDIKLENVYSDLSANVTRIYLRSTLHLFVDLAFHSVLLFEFEGKLTKGWTEILVVGDSSQGKTEVADGLMRHYGVGEKAVCKNASLAGLMGGLKQIGTQWYVSWGVIPTHDKRLVVLEELKGASIDVIARLTDMRSSGIAEIPKIEKRRTHARTRLLALSNPRNDRVMSSFSFGVEAIKDLIGAPEDIRRFDAALIVAAGEVNITELTTTIKSPPQVTHVYNASLCNQLVIWGWTRKHQEVIFEPEAVEEIFKATEDLCSKFTESVPLIDRGSMRLKLARLSAALAVRTFSTDDGSVLKIRGCHVRYIHRLLKRVYESPVFGYKYYTDAYTVTRVLRDPEVLTNRLQALAYPDETVAAMLYADGFDIVDLTDWTGFDRTQAQDLLSLLVRKQAVRRVGGKYFKTPEFIAFLKALPAESKQSRPQEKF